MKYRTPEPNQIAPGARVVVSPASRGDKGDRRYKGAVGTLSGYSSVAGLAHLTDCDNCPHSELLIDPLNLRREGGA